MNKNKKMKIENVRKSLHKIIVIVKKIEKKNKKCLGKEIDSKLKNKEMEGNVGNVDVLLYNMYDQKVKS